MSLRIGPWSSSGKGAVRPIPVEEYVSRRFLEFKARFAALEERLELLEDAVFNAANPSEAPTQLRSDGPKAIRVSEPANP